MLGKIILPTRNAVVWKVENLHDKYEENLKGGGRNRNCAPYITSNICLKIVQCIKQNNASIRNTPGTTLSNTQGEVIYTPPSGEQIICEKLANLEKFINEDKLSSGEHSRNIDPLIKMAILHYQFEAIHPFSDGNGRTGRILLLLCLKISGLLETPAIYLSEYIIKNKIEYYRCIKAVTEKTNGKTTSCICWT